VQDAAHAAWVAAQVAAYERDADLWRESVIKEELGAGRAVKVGTALRWRSPDGLPFAPPPWAPQFCPLTVKSYLAVGGAGGGPNAGARHDDAFDDWLEGAAYGGEDTYYGGGGDPGAGASYSPGGFSGCYDAAYDDGYGYDYDCGYDDAGYGDGAYSPAPDGFWSPM